MGDRDNLDGRTVFIGQLSFRATEADVREVFEKCGEVESVRIITDRETKKPKGFGFVTFLTRDGAVEALKSCNGQVIVDRYISCNISKPKSEGGGGHRYESRRFSSRDRNNYSSGPNNYRSGPNSYGSGPNSYGGGSNNYGSGPNNYAGGPNNHGSGPNNYGSGPNNYRGDYGRSYDYSSYNGPSGSGSAGDVNRRSDY